MNYSDEYNTYWARSDRMGESSGDLQRTADEILLACGGGSILDVGSGEGALVCALLDRGANAFGVDVSEIVVARSNKRAPGRFLHGSILALPLDDEAFDTVVSTDCMEHLAPEDVPNALREIHRVARRNVFLKIATTQDRDNHWHLTVEGRAWWEARCFEAGFRKHPAYYKINDYESLNQDGWQICILLEKLPQEAANAYPLASLSEERGLHMDMLRDGGERSDAHVIRYYWASGYVKPGDRVLDAACGLGYGGRVIRSNTRAARVVGVDGSDYAIDYANKSFSDGLGRIEYRVGMLPEALSSFEDGSFDVITSFETLEHVADPEAVLREFHRILAPGGRILVSVPNDWSDETGEDPNPYHLHVYDWHRLKSEIGASFTLEEAYAQTASQCKISSSGNVWERRQRLLRKVEITEAAPVDCEWWLMVAMKSPLEPSAGYTERVFANIANTSHPSIRYGEFFTYPWLMYSMVNVSHRMRNLEALSDLARKVLESSPKQSNDYLAALCVTAYRTLEQRGNDTFGVEKVIQLIDEVVGTATVDAMGLRWKVSLLFVKAKLFQAVGDLVHAKAAYVECASHDVRAFGVHLATKTTEASFIAGRIAHSLGDLNEARLCWQRGIGIGNQLLAVSLEDILISCSHPNLFNHGDGVREYVVAWDNIARCANGLNLLAEGAELDESLLQGCFQTEYAVVTRDVVSCRGQLDDVTHQLIAERRTLEERTDLLERSSEAIESRTKELVDTRVVLKDRTTRLEECSAELLIRTDEIVRMRQELAGRTGLLEHSNAELRRRTGLLERANAELIERTGMLGRANRETENVGKRLAEYTEMLGHANAELIERTGMLERANRGIDSVRRELAEHIEMLGHANEELIARASELSEVRQTLDDKTRLLGLANSEVARLSQGLLKRMWRRVCGG